MFRDLYTAIGAVVVWVWVAIVSAFAAWDVWARTSKRLAVYQRERRRRRARRQPHPIAIRFGAVNDKLAVAALLAMLDSPSHELRRP